ncbi:CLAVATA3/ESR (CLE)-related protein 25 [Quillaja saponaria]|uniref:CLAVATA3/ESR (CLE)-related protein 25 n=1 Tax=Quillaja saponaria TaxID=32244 RepID=A0AAD7PFJ1_QUISA|nr:CLAVATA3/ESR (CLE)-related protein 25 [Quillaja saponaria]
MFICVLVVGSSGEGIARRATTAAAGNIKHGDVIQGRVKLQGAHLDQLDHLNYTSKRRVPNGPDPIHNRRSGNSRRPPGTQA